MSLEISTGERVVVCGPSGSGKSTLIRCINQLEHPETGKILIDGTEIKTGRIHYDVLSGGQLKKHQELMVAKPAIGFLHDCYLT